MGMAVVAAVGGGIAKYAAATQIHRGGEGRSGADGDGDDPIAPMVQALNGFAKLAARCAVVCIWLSFAGQAVNGHSWTTIMMPFIFALVLTSIVATFADRNDAAFSSRPTCRFACCNRMVAWLLPARVHRLRATVAGAVAASYVGVYYITRTVVTPVKMNGLRMLTGVIALLALPLALNLVDAFAEAIHANYGDGSSLRRVTTRMVGHMATVVALVVFWSTGVVKADFERTGHWTSWCELDKDATPEFVKGVSAWNIYPWPVCS